MASLSQNKDTNSTSDLKANVKRIALLIDFKFEDLEATYPNIRLAEEQGFVVDIIGIHKAGMKYTGKFGYPLKSTHCIDDIVPSDYSAVVIPGGFAPDYMRRSEGMKNLVTTLMKLNRVVAAICHGPWMLCSARCEDNTPVCKGRRVTCFEAIKDDVINAGADYVADESVVVDGNLITAQTPNDLTPWCLAIIDAIKKNN